MTTATSPTILVVDDEPNIVELARLYLRTEGFKVEAAQDGREELQKVAALKPSLVVLDLMMPEVDGWEVTRRLREVGDRVPPTPTGPNSSNRACWSRAYGRSCAAARTPSGPPACSRSAT